uniref:Uncharacterized protein n=1 Tax=Arundo donax TaxID=35708 RepID=A0A0A9EUM9_ARUDO
MLILTRSILQRRKAKKQRRTIVQRFGNSCHHGEISPVSPIITASAGTSEGLKGDPVISYCSALKSARVLIGNLYSGWTQALSGIVKFSHLLGFNQPLFIGSEDTKHSTLDRTLLFMLAL